MLKPSKFLLNGLQDFAGEIKYHYEENPMLCKKVPEQLRKSISKLHAKSLREKARHIYFKGSCQYGSNTVGFDLDDSKTYDKKGAEEEWITSGQSVKTGAINFQILIPQGQLERSCLLIYAVIKKIVV